MSPIRRLLSSEKDFPWQKIEDFLQIDYGGQCPPYIKLREWEMNTYAKLSKDMDTGYNLFLSVVSYNEGKSG